MSATLMDAAGINAAIVKIRSQSKDVQQMIHETAVSVLAHVRDHGDTTLAVRLLSALPTGQRREALAFWFNKFSNKMLSLNNSKDAGWVAKLKTERKPEDFDIEGASETDYGDLIAEPKVKPVTLKALLSAVEKFIKNDKKLDDGTPVVPAEVVVVAQRMLKAAAG